jgi:RNA polymerase sigma-70 factor (ECF subfamily)
MEISTLESIIIGCMTNDRKSQNKLYELYAGIAYRLVSKYYKDKSTIDDVVQTAFIKIYNNLHKYKYISDGSFTGWIKKLVKNHTIDNIRKKQINIDYCDNLLLLNDYSELENFENIKEVMVNDILDLSNNLSKSYGLVFKMYFLDEMSHKDISNNLGINEGTSKSNLHKAKNKIREKLKNKVYYYVR